MIRAFAESAHEMTREGLAAARVECRIGGRKLVRFRHQELSVL
ncbi:hypothetical protein [Deinococcus psychrotolerans]|nr:hypothetical protein [Deinococcus psychrotolerans]